MLEEYVTPVQAEVIEEPGPAMSGFGPAGTLSLRGPRDEKEARVSDPG